MVVKAFIRSGNTIYLTITVAFFLHKNTSIVSSKVQVSPVQGTATTLADVGLNGDRTNPNSDSSNNNNNHTDYGYDDLCIDRDPSCQEWSRAAECRKSASFSYMKANCAKSCNYCNPSFERWVPPDARTADDVHGINGSGNNSGNHNSDKEDGESRNGVNGVNGVNGQKRDNIIKNGPQKSRSWLLLQYDKFPIYHGVKQKTNFSDSSSMINLEMELLYGPPMSGVEYHQLRANDVLHSMDSYLNKMYADVTSVVVPDGQKKRLVHDIENPHHLHHYKMHEDRKNHARIQHDDDDVSHNNSINGNNNNNNNMNYVNSYNNRRKNHPQKSFIPNGQLLGYASVDVEEAPVGARLPLPETCINRHPNCALWASLGYCESNMKQMGSMCSPACHICQGNLQTDRGVAYQETFWRHSPYLRGDLYGMLENIYKDKIVAHVNLNAFNMNLKNQYFPSNMDIELRNCGSTNEAQYLKLSGVEVQSVMSKRSEEDQEMYKEELKSNGTGTVLSNILTLEDLFSPEECQGLLDTVGFGIGVDSNKFSDTKEDGFPDKTTDVIKIDKDTDITVRSSSHVQLFPSIRDQKGIMRYSNSIERLLIKVNLLTGMEASQRVEAPIVFEKYEVGDEKHVVDHFKSAVLNSERNLYHWDGVGVREGDQYIDNQYFHTHAVKPDRMENARVFGFTVFLSGDGEGGEGGELYFPKMGLDIVPKKGSAVLFPTVASLIGQERASGKTRNDDHPALDEHFDHMGDYSTTLVEETHTVFGHKPVTRGTKYCVTFYFRRYQDENRLHLV